MKLVWNDISPICYLGDSNLVCYKYGIFYVYNASTLELVKKIKTPFSFLEHIAARVRYINRFLRLGVRCSMPLSASSFVYYCRNRIYEVNTETDMLSDGMVIAKGVRPLKFTEVKGINSFDDGIYFGGYLSNPTKDAVSIYRRKATNQWEIVYTFGEGLINHIHDLVADKENDCFWILTGDFENAAGIWKATNNFNSVEKVLMGNQLFRACVAFPTVGGLLYATDSQLEQNSIRLLISENGIYKSKHLKDINGSCIYGTSIGDTYFFATSVEGIGIYKKCWQFFTDRVKGPGIKDYQMYIYSGNIRDGFKIIYSQKKDWLPFSFQFGAFQFPAGINRYKKLILKHIATSDADMSTIILSETEL
ncbi:hypothetical protein [Bacteroides oleiciplenus]|uniref:hypothetical protein n=1 Tax=Bacteroides oleiciplenus TaxID=626931 RepID=UPI0026DBBEEA|nr:hypothetical protein [Bacteroides oleiciplenus]